jgi:hypothetical protein
MPSNEDLLTLSEIAERLPIPKNRTTLWRWCRIGVRGIRLEYRKLGREMLTSVEAVERFSQALAQADTEPRHGEDKRRANCFRSPAPESRKRSVDIAEDFLRDLGI